MLEVLAQAVAPVVSGGGNLGIGLGAAGIMIGAGIAVAGARPAALVTLAARLLKPSPVSRKPRVRSART